MTLTNLWREAIVDGVHGVAGCRLAHESVSVAGKAVPIGRETVGRAAVTGEAALMHGGGGQRLRPVHRATAICRKQ